MIKSIQGILVILFLSFLLEMSYGRAQMEQPIVDKEKMNKTIYRFEEIYNRKITPENLAYIRENISSPELISIIADWENRHKIYFEEYTMLILWVNLLDSEIEFETVQHL